LRPLGVSQNESVHPKLESQPSPDENPESQQTLVNECVRLTNRPSIRIEPCFHPSHFANRPTKANAELVEVTDFSLAPLPRFHQLLDSISLLFGGGIQRKSGRATPVMTSSFENA
ncbi:hypothetical protein, partial [Bradyrhizobium sp. 197]|uniref:hypothetical protein n=1 Tax=Bradyrhizobium sp. 197 TaxID=2782663 RepID=UPI001FF858D7